MKSALLLLALIPFAAGGHPGQEGAGAVPCGTPKHAKLRDFRVPILGTTAVEHVVLLEERIGCDLLLQFRKGNGLVVASMGDGRSRPSMTLAEFTAALDGALSAIEKEHPEGHIGDVELDQVQLDAFLVDELWEAVVAATKAEAANLRGVVEPHNKRLVEAINRALARSRTVAASCDVLKSHSYVCDPGSERQEAVALPSLSPAGAGERGVLHSSIAMPHRRISATRALISFRTRLAGSGASGVKWSEDFVCS